MNDWVLLGLYFIGTAGFILWFGWGWAWPEEKVKS